MRTAWVLIVGSFAACGDPPIDKTGVCRSAATVEDRKVIGLAAPYVPDLELAARDAELEQSIAQRRAMAWQIVERVLRPVPLGEPKLAAHFGSQPAIPAWHTWYGRDDFDRVFKKLYRDLGPEGRAARAPLDVPAGLAWNAVALDGDPAWPEQRYLEYLAGIDSTEEANGVGGVSRVGYSPGAVGHLINSYAKQYACRGAVDPDRFEDDPVRAGRAVLQRETVDVDGCELRVLGPIVAGAGEVRVRASADGDGDLYVRRGAPPSFDEFDCRANSAGAADEECVVAGGGLVYVAVFGAEPAHVDVAIEYVAEDVRDPACLDGELPRDAVLVKAEWRRDLGDSLPVFDTSALRMAARLAGDARWNADGVADPSASDIYSVVLQNGLRFRMPALHIMTKELDHWVWITLWYSPDPDRDFGADRPASLVGPWRSYKMCVATSYVEHDPDARGGHAGSLGDALAAVHRGPGAPSWCSNPYLEEGAGNAATNCIGCHQHGGTALRSEAILANEPLRGVTRTRNNFFTDYLWVVKGGGGEELSALIQAEVDFWDATDP